MATIREIAKECGVSISTVSNILNGKEKASKKTKEIVLQKARELNYVPNYMAKNLKQKNTKTIGVIAEDLTIFHTPVIVDGISELLEEKGYKLLMGNMRLYQKYGNEFYLHSQYEELVSSELQEVAAKKVEGILYVEGHYHIMRSFPEMLQLPLVAVYGRAEREDILSVIYDDEQGAYQATKELLVNGHKKVGIIKGNAFSHHTSARMKGYLRALYEHGVLYNPQWEIQGNWNREDGYKGAKKLLEYGVTAIFAMNDLMAGGVYDYANEQGIRVGKDISLIGFDDREISQAFYPELSTVRLPLRQMGRISAQLLIEQLEGKEIKKEDYKIPCEIIRRKSVCML